MIYRSRLTFPAVVFLGACASAASNPFDATGPAAAQVEVYVDNRGFNDVRLYAISSRGPQSLGSVTGSSHRSVRVDWRQLDQMSFRIDVLAGQSYRTEAITVAPGDRVDLLIADNPENSILKVR